VDREVGWTLEKLGKGLKDWGSRKAVENPTVEGRPQYRSFAPGHRFSVARWMVNNTADPQDPWLPQG
jgi:hypothetical protein